jgi:predicted NBD/HSP70 family sugar kinase
VRKGNAQLVKKINKFNVIQCLLVNGPLSQEEIIQITKLSRPTVVEIIKSIQNEKLISKAGSGKSSGGRIPTLYGIDPLGYYTIGIDFEYPQVHMGILNFFSEPVIERKFSVLEALKADAVLQELLASVEAMLAEFGHAAENIIGIGIGLPGIIDLANGMSTKIERINGWTNIPIKKIFEDKFSIPTLFNNDVHLMANYERKMQKDLPNNFIYVGIRSGIGMAAVDEKGTYFGTKGNAGFLGHMTVDIDGPRCVCGRYGCLEAVAGEMSLKKKYFEMCGKKLTLRDEDTSVYDHLSYLAGKGDWLADQLLLNASKYLACGVANIMKILEIPTIILDGWQSENNDKYIKNFQEQLKSLLFENLLNEVRIIFSKADPEMVIKACSNYVIENFINTKYAL